MTGTVTTDDGNAADTVDVRCYYQDYGASWDTVQNSVPVQPDGTFSATGNPGNSRTCRMMAVPSGYNGPIDTNTYKDKVYGTGYSSISTLNTGSGQPNNGTPYDYYIDQHQLKGYIEWESAGSCGADWSNVFAGNNFQDYSDYSPMDCSDAQYTNGQGDRYGRSELQVDSVNAYNSNGAAGVNQTAGNFPGLTVTHSTDPNTGDLTINEGNQIVTCGTAAWPAPSTCDPSNNNNFKDSGVHFDRVIKQGKDGLAATVTDTYTSTDGAQHAIDAEFDFYSYQDDVAAFKVPGDNRYRSYAQGDVINLPAQSQGTIFTRDNTYPAGDDPYYSLPGSYTYTTQPDRMFFNYGDNQCCASFVLDYKRTVPAGGSVSITHSMTQGLTPADVASASDSQAPTVTITNPANGSSTTAEAVLVSGTASDDNGVPTVTVNGVPVAVGNDGSWTVTVGLKQGANTITAVAKDAAGNSSQTAITVYRNSSQCIVPKVTGLTTAQAASALTNANCKVGAQTASTSRTVPKGQVISQSIPAGLAGSPGLPVDIRISTGKFTGASLASKSVKLNGTSLVLTVRCGNSAVQTGTVKIRTLTGQKKTLGTAPFSCPKGKKRTVKFSLSRTSASALKKQGTTKAKVFIVARNSSGDSAQRTGNLTIKG